MRDSYHAFEVVHGPVLGLDAIVIARIKTVVALSSICRSKNVQASETLFFEGFDLGFGFRRFKKELREYGVIL